MFEHSVKVPRHYKIAANIFKQVSTEGGSVKTLLYDNKLRHFRTDVLYALITETIKHASDIDKMFEASSILTNEPRLDPWLAKVLITELLFGKKTLPGQSKPVQTILSYKEHFDKYTTDHHDDLKTEDVQRPRYVRVNTNLLTTSDAIRAFQDEGYRFIRCTSGSYDDFLKQIQGLTEYDFTQDYHVKTVFVFPPGTKLHEHELYLENKIILQDKATALAVHLLAPPPGSVVLDLCSAPGMKTTQLAAYIRNEGKIYAVERNEKRYQILCDFVKKTGSKCVETLHKDALEIKRGDYDDVEYILLDPSCSGSGMALRVHNYVEESRLAKLTSLQEKFLKHAMNAFPKAKRIVYSTCSLFPEENERVITNTVKTSRTKWRVQDVKTILKDQWNNIGSGMYGSMGTRCIYARPETDFTIGFFVAVLDRDFKDDDDRPVKRKADHLEVDKSRELESNEKPKDTVVEENPTFDSPEVKKKKKKSKKDKMEIENEDRSEQIENVELNIMTEEYVPKKKKKKSKNKDFDDINEDITETVEKTKKKKKRKKHIDSDIDVENKAIVENLTNDSTEDVTFKKKKKKKHSE